MKSITKEEKILYLALFSTCSMYSIVLLNESTIELYNLIFNYVIFIFLYTPIFLYNLLKIIKNISSAEIIIRYESIDRLIQSRVKVLLHICLRISVFSIIISSVFLFLKDINIILSKEFWIVNILSVGTQFIGWFFIGVLYLLLEQLFKSEKVAYIIEISMFASLSYILSPLLFGFLGRFILPVYQVMYFYDFNINIMNKVTELNVIIVINILIILLYKYLLKNQDMRR